MEQELNTNFFESVSRHNLERFHSECLCWLFNNNKKLAAEWIKEITKSICEIEIDSIEVYTEVDQLDIVILYKKKSFDVYFGIIIENKVKANEHLIKVKKTENFSNFKIGDELSQTEYYYFRNIATKEIIENENEKENQNNKILVQILGDGGKVNRSKNTISKVVKREDCHYVFQVPNKIVDVKVEYSDLVGLDYEYNKINSWRIGNNPWITYTYIELADFLNKNKSLLKNSITNNEIYANDYIDFLHSQFQNPVNLNNYSKNKYGKLEYMKFLRHAIYLKLKNECRELNKNGKVDSASSNSGDPLFNIVICDKIELTKEWKVLFQLGLQVQGLTNKIYISAGENYNSFKFNPKGSDVEIDELNKYRKLVEKEFDKIIYKKTGKFLFEYLGDIKLYPNKNTTKSFYSYSFTFENEDENGIDLSYKISKLSNLINEIYDIYNNTSFTSTSESNSK
jgi:hypothetical protein